MFFDFRKYSCIGILGGTFNPIHLGHMMMAETAYNQIDEIEKIVFMPNNKTAYKNNSEIEQNDHRINMLKLAIEDKEFAEISDIEQKRGGVTYTVETLKQILDINSKIKIYFIIGADSLFSFTKWYMFEQVLSMCTLLVVSRNSSKESLIETKNMLEQEYNASIILLDTEEFDASSSNIRERIKDGVDVSDKLDKKVLDYIYENNLYK